MESKAHQVLLFYRYVTIPEPEVTSSWLLGLAQKHSLLGRALVAEEGINATFEGKTEDTELFVQEFIQDPLFADIDIKRSHSMGDSFPKLSVKVRNEIVGTRFPKEVDPRVATAPHLSAEELKTWYESGKDFVVLDMRNSYEFASGHFKNSVDPGLENSRDLPDAVEKLGDLKDKTVLTVCTGGVRCEKMSAYLMNQGFSDVHQLDGGIHTYMEKYPGEDYEGALYTFDQRVTMDFGGEREVIGVCRLCQNKTERYVNCANNNCHLHFLVCTNCVPVGEPAYCGSCVA
ncbi:MAG: rhodanese-related sulfurtransferase [Patescibacteria group bacterium]